MKDVAKHLPGECIANEQSQRYKYQIVDSEIQFFFRPAEIVVVREDKCSEIKEQEDEDRLDDLEEPSISQIMIIQIPSCLQKWICEFSQSYRINNNILLTKLK